MIPSSNPEVKPPANWCVASSSPYHVSAADAAEKSGVRPARAEVVGFNGDRAYLMPTGDVHGLASGARVIPRPTPVVPLKLGAVLHPWRRGEDRTLHLPVGDGLLGRVDPAARPAVQDLVYGSLRAYGCGDFYLARLLTKPLYVDEVRALLLVAMGYDTLSMNATSLARVKAALRRFSRAEADELLATVLLLDDVFAELDTARRRALAGVAATAEQVLVTAAVGEDIPPDWDARRIGITLQDDESGRISVVNP